MLTDASLAESKRINEVCHSSQPAIPFIRVGTRGVFASVFTDFGQDFTVYDVDGEWRACCLGWVASGGRTADTAADTSST